MCVSNPHIDDLTNEHYSQVVAFPDLGRATTRQNRASRTHRARIDGSKKCNLSYLANIERFRDVNSLNKGGEIEQ